MRSALDILVCSIVSTACVIYFESEAVDASVSMRARAFARRWTSLKERLKISPPRMRQKIEEKQKRKEEGGQKERGEKRKSAPVHWRQAKAKNQKRKLDVVEQALHGLEISTANCFCLLRYW